MTRTVGTQLVVACHNEGKVGEIRALLAPYGIETVSAAELGLPVPEEPEETFEGNAALKALAAARAADLPALSDDSGIEIDALGGAPGVHTADWAETPEEQQWLERGEGPFAAWLGPSPRCTGTERLQRAGLLAGSLLVHGNEPSEGEVERVAAAGATVVHCPGSHVYFGRRPFDWGRFASAGVPLALGTDSWASNERLDMRREIRLARETVGLDAASAWRAATEIGAALLPWEHVTGRGEVGAAADRAVFVLKGGASDAADRPGRILDALTLEEPDLAGLHVAGNIARG